jgi:SPP1 gp7 family putative phage head morphogenesis protein
MARFHDRARQPGLVKARKLEEGYARQLRKVARQIGMIVEGWYAQHEDELDPSALPGLQQQMERYSEILEPWARATAQRIGQEIAIKERRGWAEHARLMSRARREELANAPTGAALKQFLNEQVQLITSLPTDAGQRVHDLTLRGLETSTRASEIAKEILRSGEVTASRATLIARTEVARTASALTMVRAMSIGSNEYIWRTSRDGDVRPSHKKMEGRVCQWAHPPTLSDGTTCHAGQIYNCRCWPEPIIPGIDV